MRLSKNNNTLVLLGIFAAAMGFLEAIVVVYLRELYYPNGFTFPLRTIPTDIIAIELIREIATIIMLLCIAALMGKNFLQRFAFFLYTFGVWDIFYYIALKAFLNWPASLLTWDILFLIPLPWVGPVLAPLICSITMFFLAGCILYFQGKGYTPVIKRFEWTLILLGAFIVFITFVQDYCMMIIQGGFLSSFFTLAENRSFQLLSSRHVPLHYNWFLFCVGEVLIITAIIVTIRKTRKQHV